MFRTLVNFGNQTYNITYRNNNGIEMLVLNSSDYSLHSVSPGVYWITINNCEYEYKFYAGSVYTILIIPNSETSFVCKLKLFGITTFDICSCRMYL